jgi:hypothetical protein
VRKTSFSMKEVWVGSLLGVALCAAWLTIFIMWPVPFWQANNDYADLSLAHAVHLEASLHEKVNGDAALANHPGIPFYIASWMALRMAALSDGANDVVKFAFSNPDRFFLMAKIFAGLITAIGIGATWLLLRRIGPFWRLLAILTFFAAAPVSYRYGLVILGNETFALPLAALLFWAVDRCAKAPAASNLSWLILGAVAGLGYTVKLLYLDLLVAACAVALIDSWWSAPRLGIRLIIEFTRRIVLILVAFFALALAILLPILGRETLRGLLQFHAAIFTHSGNYGSGEVGFISTAAVDRALLKLLANTALPYMIILVVVGLCMAVWSKLKTHTLDRHTALWTAASLAAIISASAAILKHFDVHYLVALCALLPFAFSPVLALPRARWIAGAAVVACLGWTTYHAAVEFSQESDEVAAVLDDVAAIRAMPLAPGEARLWAYRSPTEEFSAAFIASYSGVESVIKALADPALQDFSPYSMVKRPYKYVVLDRKDFPDANAIRKIEGSLDRVQGPFVPLAPDDKILELRRLIVVEKTAP